MIMQNLIKTDYLSDLSNDNKVISIEKFQISSLTDRENILSQQYNEIIKLLEVLNKNGFNNDLFADSLYKISTKTKITASFILRLILKNNINMPLVHPDEDEGLVMTWKTETLSNILIVDEDVLHFSMESNDGKYQNIENIPLNINSLSKSGLHHIPLSFREFIKHLQK